MSLEKEQERALETMLGSIFRDETVTPADVMNKIVAQAYLAGADAMMEGEIPPLPEGKSLDDVIREQWVEQPSTEVKK